VLNEQMEKNALEFLPELKVTIEGSESPAMRWLDIFFELKQRFKMQMKTS